MDVVVDRQVPQQELETVAVLLRSMVRIRTMALPILITLVVSFWWIDPVPWKLWFIAVVLGPLFGLFAIDGALLISRGRPLLGPRLTLTTMLSAQFSLLFITGGIESPLLIMFPAFSLLVGLFYGSPRRFLRPALAMAAVTLVFAAGPSTGLLPRSVPRFFELGPGFYDRPIYVWTIATLVVGFLVFGTQVGGWLRRTLDREARDAVGARRQALEALASRNHEIVSAASTVAHELKNPLAAIRGLAQLSSREPDIGDKQRERLAVMLAEIDRMGLVLDGFRTLTKPLGELSVESCSLVAIARDVVALHEGVAATRGSRVLLRPGPDVRIECDPLRVKQALVNLVQNGIEATRPGGTVELRVSPPGDSGDSATIEVRDDGPGIASTMKGQLFKAGFTTKARGAGFGLVVARSLAEQHGGRLTLDDAPEGGCRAILSLPRRCTEHGAAA